MKLTAGQERLCLCLFSAALLTALAVASRFATGIVVQADEGSYLLNAAAIAGRLNSSELLYNYYSGYSLLLAPIFLLLQGFDAIYGATLLLNCLLVASIPFALARLIAVVYPDVEPSRRLFAAASATCFTPLLVLSQFAFADAALASVFAWSLAAAATALKGGSRSVAVACGALLGFLLLIHARGVALSLPFLCILFALATARREHRATATTIWLCALAIGALHGPLEFMAGKGALSGLHDSSATSMLSPLASLTGWIRLMLNTGGALVVAIVGSSGLIVLLAIGVFRNVRRSPFELGTVMMLASLTAVAACILVTAMFFNPPLRADHIVYGRYLLPAMAPSIALGLAGIASAEPRARSMLVPLIVGQVLIVSMACAFRIVTHPPLSNWNHVTAVELFVPYKLAGTLNWVVVGLWFFFGCSITLGSARLGRIAPALVFAALNVGVAAYMFNAYTLPARQYYGSGRYIVETAREFAAQSDVPLCISIDPSLSDWHKIDFRSRLYNQLARSTHPEQAKCVPARVVPVKVGMAIPMGMVPLEVETTSPAGPFPVALLVEKDLAIERFLSRRSSPRVERLLPVPADQRVADVSALVGTNDIVDATVGSRTEFRVRVTNRSRMRWLAEGLAYPLRLGIRVREGGGGASVLEDRVALAETLAPGASREFLVPIGPVSQPGHYEVTIGVVQEAVAWFDGALTFELEVRSATTELLDRP